MSNWYQNLGDSEDEDPPDPGFNEASADNLMNPDSYEDEDGEANMPELLAYRDFISKSPAYE